MRISSKINALRDISQNIGSQRCVRLLHWVWVRFYGFDSSGIPEVLLKYSSGIPEVFPRYSFGIP